MITLNSPTPSQYHVGLRRVSRKPAPCHPEPGPRALRLANANPPPPRNPLPQACISATCQAQALLFGTECLLLSPQNLLNEEGACPVLRNQEIRLFPFA